MASRIARPQLEILEGRLSSRAGGKASLGIGKPHDIILNGAVGGKFSLAPGLPDVGASQMLAGSGKVATLGHVRASGTMRSPGFIAQGRSTGVFNLSNAKGSVTIQLTGPLAGLLAAPPSVHV